MIRVTALTAALATTVFAQDLTVTAAPQSRPLYIVGATLHTMTRSPFVGTLGFEDGKIVSVIEGPTVPDLPDDAVRIAAVGKHIYPGLISASTTIGLTEIGSARATRDADEIGEITPEVRAAVAVNPDSTAIPVTRSNGVLVAGIVPTGGLIPGRLSVLRLEGCFDW